MNLSMKRKQNDGNRKQTGGCQGGGGLGEGQTGRLGLAVVNFYVQNG